MFEEYQICPYTGLRSFTEEESLYFKAVKIILSRQPNSFNVISFDADRRFRRW
jgi:hypothetical protein